MSLQRDAVPGQLRKMHAAELERLSALTEIVFAEDQKREGRSFRAELQNLSRLLPLLRLVVALRPSVEELFYTLVWDTGDSFAAAVTIGRHGKARRRWYIANVATHPDYRGRGLARTMTNAALDHIRARGGSYVLLEVRADNEPAYRLYRSLGFLRLRTDAVFKGEAHSIAVPLRPEKYTLRALPATDWRTRLRIAQRTASAETQAVCPPTAEQFQGSALIRGLQSLINRVLQIRSRTWIVEEAGQPIGLVHCQMSRSGVRPHHVQINLAADHQDVAPYTIVHAIRSCSEIREGPLLVGLAGQPQAAAGFLESLGFTSIQTMHQLGLKL